MTRMRFGRPTVGRRRSAERRLRCQPPTLARARKCGRRCSTSDCTPMLALDADMIAAFVRLAIPIGLMVALLASVYMAGYLLVTMDYHRSRGDVPAMRRARMLLLVALAILGAMMAATEWFSAAPMSDAGDGLRGYQRLKH